MPDSTPSLGEILNFQVDPDLGGGAPNIVFDNRQLLQTVNDNARYQAENSWRKYGTFQKALADTFQNIADVSGLEVATQDREQLDAERKDLLDSIWKNPKEFFGSGNMVKRAEIEAKLSKYKSAATESKLNRTFDMAHRQFINQNPELNTDENKETIDSYWQQPLGQRKSYNLNMPTVFDYGAFSKGIYGSPGVSVTELKNEYTPDKKFIDEYEETTLKRDQFINRWMTGLMANDKYGHSLKTYADQQFKKLSADEKKRLGVSTPEEFWKVFGEQTFGSANDITTRQKGKRVANPYALEQQQASNRLVELKRKHGYDIDTINHKDKLNGKTAKGKVDDLKNFVSFVINDAKVNGGQLKSKKPGEPFGESIVDWFETRLSPEDAKMYQVGSGVLTDVPKIYVSPDGKKFKAVYKDPSNDKEFTQETFLLDVGKNKFGLGGLGKQDVSIEEDASDGNTDETITTTPSKTKTSTKIKVPGL